MDKERLDENNPDHKILIAAMALIVDDRGYTPHQLFNLMDDAKRQLWPALAQMSAEKGNK